MAYINVVAPLESFRRFLVLSTCHSFIPEGYMMDPEVFPEKEGEAGSIYVEAADKVTLKKIGDITFINATDILGILYTSKSGNTRLRWRQTRDVLGRVTGEASTNSLVNLATARVITPEYTEQLAMGLISPPRPPAGGPEAEEPSMPEEGAYPVESDASTSETLNQEGSFRTAPGG